MAKNVKQVVIEGEHVGADAQEVLNEGAENSSTEKENEAKVTKEAGVVAPKTKLVKIHTTEEVDCYVGNLPYKFGKDKNIEVPSDVAAILVNARKAYRQ